MSFDLIGLRRAVEVHGKVVRVVLADIKGSVPREVGASMLVWTDGQSGTIGGGALEYAATEAARQLTEDRLTKHPLGPDLGQCCGGAVTLLSEIYDAKRVEALDETVIARGPGDMPLTVKRMLATARGAGTPPAPAFMDGWMIEPVSQPDRHVWVWGAGHVGRALVGVLAPLPNVSVTWVDTGPERFPDVVPDNVTVLPVAKPGEMVKHTTVTGEHYILTYSHALDLELCHQLLRRGFRSAGLIGSATKWARFRKRLAELGHTAEAIARITCPIGDLALGKHPQAIAVGVVAEFLSQASVRAGALRA